MKKLLALPLLFILLCGFTSNWEEPFTDEQGLTWYTTLEDAHLNAEKSKKPIMALFTGSDWCKPCMALKKDVFETNRFAKWAKKNVVLLYLDYPIRKQMSKDFWKHNNGIKSTLKTSGLPVVVFFDAQRESEEAEFTYSEYGRIEGSVENETLFIDEAESFLKK